MLMMLCHPLGKVQRGFYAKSKLKSFAFLILSCNNECLALGFDSAKPQGRYVLKI
jgi:hypothetical protein